MGMHPDVISADLSWVIECGNTEPASILLFFTNKNVKKISILPYLFKQEDKFKLYTFQKAKNFTKFKKIKKQVLKETFFSVKS